MRTIASRIQEENVKPILEEVFKKFGRREYVIEEQTFESDSENRYNLQVDISNEEYDVLTKEMNIVKILYSVEGTEMERTFFNDKKKNVSYWDNIDGIVENSITDIANFSASPVNEDLTDLIAETRDFIINNLEKYGAYFPYIEENF